MKIHFGKRAAGGEAGLTQVKPKHKKGKWTKRVIALVLAAALAGGGAWYFLGRRTAAASAPESSYTETAVERRDITATITGSGSLEAANTYSVTHTDGNAHFCTGRIVKNRKYFRFFD